MVDSHSISDGLGAAWNGIVGKIELRATPPVWIDDVQVFTLGTQGVVHVIVHIGNITGKTGNGFLSVCSSGPFPIIKNSSVKWEKSKYAMFPINTFEFAPDVYKRQPGMFPTNPRRRDCNGTPADRRIANKLFCRADATVNFPLYDCPPPPFG